MGREAIWNYGWIRWSQKIVYSLESEEITSFIDSYGSQAYRGKLPDGTTVVVRSSSSYGTPTVEFQFKGGKYESIHKVSRYANRNYRKV